MILTADNGDKYRLNCQEEDHFLDIYADCLLREDGLTVWEYYIQQLVKAAGMCNHNIDDDIAEDILEEYRDDLEDLEEWTEIDFIRAVKDYYDEEYFDPSMTDRKVG